MSAVTVVQALGWVAVVVLTTVHLLVERGRLPDGRVHRIAGCAAAAATVAAAVSTGMWPVAVLGLLWLRTEVFAHRIMVPPRAPEDARHSSLLELGLADPDDPQAVNPDGRPAHHPPQLPHPHLPHLPHVHLPRPAGIIAILFKIEVIALVVVGLILANSWWQSHNNGFGQGTSRTICMFRPAGC